MLADHGYMRNIRHPYRRSGTGQKADPPPPLPPDGQGWRVPPPSDGRGTPEQHRQRPPHRLTGFWLWVLVLLAITVASVLASEPAGQPRVKVPFGPYFLQQLSAGNVASISLKNDTIQGTLATAVRYPPGGQQAIGDDDAHRRT